MTSTLFDAACICWMTAQCRKQSLTLSLSERELMLNGKLCPVKIGADELVGIGKEQVVDLLKHKLELCGVM